MARVAAQIVADALEISAAEHEAAQLSDLAARREAVLLEVKPINDIPRPVFKLAIYFLKEWDWASRNGWDAYDSMDEGDWPAMARVIAASIHTGHLPRDKKIIEVFVRRRSRVTWGAISRLIGSSSE